MLQSISNYKNKKVIIIKLLSFFIIGIFILFISLIIAQKYVNWNYIFNNKLEKYFSTSLPKYKIDFGAITCNFWQGKMQIKNITISTNNINQNENELGVINTSLIDEIIVPLTIMDFFSSNIDLNRMIVKSPKIFISKDVNLFDFFASQRSIRIDIENGHFIIKNLFYNFEKEFKELNGVLNYDNEKKLNFNFKVKIDKDYYQTSFNYKNNNHILKIIDDENDFLIEFNGNNYNNGKINGTGKNFWNFVRNISSIKKFSFIPFDFNQDNFKFITNFSLNNSMLELNDFKLISDFCDINLSIINDKLDKNQSLNLNINKLNLESLIKKSKNSLQNKNTSYFDYFSNIDHEYVLNSNINIKNLNFNKNVIESNVSFDIVNKSLIFNKFLANFNNSSNFSLQGNTLLTDNNQTKLYANVDFSGDDLDSFFNLLGLKSDLYKMLEIDNESFALKAELNVLPLMTILTNFSLQIGDNFFNSKNLLYKSYQDTHLILGELNGHGIKINSDYLKNDLQNNLLALKNFIASYRNDLDISSNIDHAKFNDKQIVDLSFNTSMLHNKFIINNIYTNIDEENFGGKIGFYNRAIRPLIILDMKLNALKFYLHEFERKTIESGFLKKFDTDLTLQSANLYINDMMLQNFSLHGSINNNLAIFDKLSFDILGGTANLISLFDFSNFILKSNVKMENINLLSLLKNNRFFDFDGGTFSLNGYIKSYGKNVYELTKKLYGQMKIAGKNLEIKNFDIDYLARNLIKIDKTDDVKKVLDRVLYGGNTTFNTFSGAFIINNGLMKSNIKMTSGLTGGNFMGNIDIWEKSVDGLARFIFRPNYLNEKKKYEKFVVDVKVKGILNSPERYVDDEAIKKYLFMGINPWKKKK